MKMTLLEPMVLIFNINRLRWCIIILAQCIAHHKFEKEKGNLLMTSQVKSSQGHEKNFLKSVKSSQWYEKKFFKSVKSSQWYEKKFFKSVKVKSV